MDLLFASGDLFPKLARGAHACVNLLKEAVRLRNSVSWRVSCIFAAERASGSIIFVEDLTPAQDSQALTAELMREILNKEEADELAASFVTLQLKP
jgi:hypothetical protein